MSRPGLGNAFRHARSILAVAVVACVLPACAKIEIAPHLAPLPDKTVMLLGKKHMQVQAPIFIRIYKEESELEVWKMRDDGRYYHFKSYPICNWSGRLGPKLREGDRQSPEGFYRITREQMNPGSKYHLAFNLGYPNPFDKAHRRTGAALMVHGGCGSSGCYAMTDALMEEIYALVREAFIGGQDVVHVHAFPFRMTTANMARYSKSKWRRFWRTLKKGYDYFELTRQVPTVAVCNGRYLVNVRMSGIDPAKLNPRAACPPFRHPAPSRFVPKADEEFAAQRIVAPGQRMRTVASYGSDASMSGLTKTPDRRAPWWRRFLPRFDLFGTAGR